MKVLVIAAHPDDEVLGCGGTMRLLADHGHEVHVQILGEGLTSRSGNQDSLSELRKMAEASGKRLGVKKIHFEQLPDNRLDEIALIEVVKLIEKKVEEISPEIVFAHHVGDLNVDHSVSFRAALTALRPMEGRPTRAFLAFEVASSSEWAFQAVGPSFRPNYFVDISTTLEHKVGAMKEYKSELREFPHPRSEQNLRASAVRWGANVGAAAAEPFQIIWSLGKPGQGLL